MKKYYFASKDDEMCYSMNYFKELMEYEGFDEIELIKAKRYYGEDYFWCKEFYTFEERSDNDCGKWSDGYAPRNGKSGCCKHYSLIFYEPSDKIFKLKTKL